MPLPVTPSYEKRLIALRSYAPEAIRPEVLAQPASPLEGELFDHLQAVGRQEARCVTRLSLWLNDLARGQALQLADAAAFLAEAASHGGPKGVAE
jgi:hypothetical protein